MLAFHRSQLQTLSAVAGIALIAFSPLKANAANLITNGDFSTLDLTGWTLTGGLGSSSVDLDFAAYSNGESAGNPSTLSQTFTTTPGVIYTFSFEVEPNLVTGEGAISNKFDAKWDGAPVFGFVDDGGTDFVFHTFNITAEGSSSTISFSGYNAPDSWKLDNVSVTIIPEVNTLLLLGLGGLTAGTVLVRRKK